MRSIRSMSHRTLRASCSALAVSCSRVGGFIKEGGDLPKAFNLFGEFHDGSTLNAGIICKVMADKGVEGRHFSRGIKSRVSVRLPLPRKERPERLDHSFDSDVWLEPNAVFFVPFKHDGRETNS